MAHRYPLLFKLSDLFHALIARSEFVARLYLGLVGGLLRLTPDFPFKRHILFNIRSYAWPELELPARRVEVVPGASISLIPHVGEFDFAAQFSRQLGYEQSVFLLLRERLPGYDAILEVGANVGVFTNFFASELGKNASPVPVFAFEPSRDAYFRLLQNLRVNQAKNVLPINVAIHDRVGFVDFYEPEGHLTNGSLDADFAGIFSDRISHTLVAVFCGEQVEELLNGHHRVLLKIDVEGAEEAVLKNLRSLILSRQTDIVLEVLQPYEEALNGIDFLVENFDLFLISKDGLIPKGRLEADPIYRDYLLLPRGGR